MGETTKPNCGQCGRKMQAEGDAVHEPNGRQYQKVSCECGNIDIVHLGPNWQGNRDQ